MPAFFSAATSRNTGSRNCSLSRPANSPIGTSTSSNLAGLASAICGATLRAGRRGAALDQLAAASSAATATDDQKQRDVPIQNFLYRLVAERLGAYGRRLT